MHSTIACGKDYDYYFSSTLPLEAKFHLPYAPESCKIKVAFYTKRPNRVDIEMDGTFVAANNADVGADGAITWQKPDDSFIPSIDSHNSGANYQQRSEQLVHLIISGGHTYTIKSVQTLVLELAVTTELTEDDFYDNGNLAGNIAALLGIDPSRIRVMNVVSESSGARRRRHAREGWITYGTRVRRSGAETALQLEVTPEVNNNAGADKLDEVAQSVIADPAALAGSVASALVEVDPTIQVQETIAVAAPPKQPDTPPPPVTLAEQLGLDEMQPGDDLEEFINQISKDAGFDITELETAESKRQTAQEEADKAAEPIVYDTPTTLILNATTVPTGPQMLGQRMFSTIILSVQNQDGAHMENVGYVADPYQVKAEIFEPVLVDGGDSPSIDGTTSAVFTPGSGYAMFDNLVFRGGMTSCKIKFSIKKPSDSTIAAVVTVPIEFMPEVPVGECVVEEGQGFDRKVSMTETCDHVCLAPCFDLGGLGGGAVGPECNTVTTCEGGIENPTYGTCAEGTCGCNMTEVPDIKSMNPADYMTAVCSAGAVELRMNKCVINAYGFTLKDLYINGPTKSEDFTSLDSSTHNSCRGKLAFDNGPEYVFKIDRTLTDCATDKGSEEGFAVYKNAVQGFAGVDNGVISRRKQVFIEFGCKFEVDLTVSANIGTVNSKSYEVQLEAGTGNFDVTMAVYEDSSFTKVAGSDFSVAVPDHINIGIVGTNFADTGYQIVAQNCWMTPDNDPNNAIKYDILLNGCANPDDVANIVVIENGVSGQSRFSFASFQFTGQDVTAPMYGHCAIHICDPSTETCAPDCSARKRRDATSETEQVVSFSINLHGDNAACTKSCDGSNCSEVCAGLSAADIRG
jgi:hypothetical protein